jgi:hypothetical protein
VWFSNVAKGAEAEFQTDAPRTWDIRRAGSSLADPAVA